LTDIASHPYCRSNEIVLAGLLEVHSQLLGVVPALIGPYFNDLISFVVRSYEETVCPSSLEYISAAVESFGSENSAIANVAGLDDNATEAMFSQLLAHISQCTFRFVTQTTQPKECTQVIAALFKMTQRYLLFLPAALVQCSEFASLFALGVACLTECKGEVESSRRESLTTYFFSTDKKSRKPALEDSPDSLLKFFGRHFQSVYSQSCSTSHLAQQTMSAQS
jgi:hypothetical protein